MSDVTQELRDAYAECERLRERVAELEHGHRSLVQEGVEIQRARKAAEERVRVLEDAVERALDELNMGSTDTAEVVLRAALRPTSPGGRGGEVKPAPCGRHATAAECDCEDPQEVGYP